MMRSVVSRTAVAVVAGVALVLAGCSETGASGGGGSPPGSSGSSRSGSAGAAVSSRDKYGFTFPESGSPVTACPSAKAISRQLGYAVSEEPSGPSSRKGFVLGCRYSNGEDSVPRLSFSFFVGRYGDDLGYNLDALASVGKDCKTGCDNDDARRDVNSVRYDRYRRFADGYLLVDLNYLDPSNYGNSGEPSYLGGAAAGVGNNGYACVAPPLGVNTDSMTPQQNLTLVDKIVVLLRQVCTNTVPG